MWKRALISATRSAMAVGRVGGTAGGGDGDGGGLGGVGSTGGEEAHQVNGWLATHSSAVCERRIMHCATIPLAVVMYALVHAIASPRRSPALHHSGGLSALKLSMESS